MKINTCLGLLAMCFISSVSAARFVYIVNNSGETVSIKGPIPATKRNAISLTLKPGEMVIKDAALEGGPSDTLVVTVLGHTTQKISSYSKKYTKPASALIYVDEAQPEKFGKGFDLWQTEIFSPASVTTPAIF